MQWACNLDKPKSGALPNGGGQYCYPSQLACTQGANSCNSTTCVLADTLCSTGEASANTSLNWMCSLDQPQGSMQAGSGLLCYGTGTDCANGPNSCSYDLPCENSPSLCSTGVAGGLGVYNYVCTLSIPTGAAPNGALGVSGGCFGISVSSTTVAQMKRASCFARPGAGQYCYTSQANCEVVSSSSCIQLW